MLNASALPIKGVACCNSVMGKAVPPNAKAPTETQELALALGQAMELKKRVPGFESFGPSAVARYLEIKQPSASQIFTTGRVSKKNLVALIDLFSDVVGPDHFGFPISKAEYDLIKNLRRLSAETQEALRQRVDGAIAQLDQIEIQIAAPLTTTPAVASSKQQAA